MASTGPRGSVSPSQRARLRTRRRCYNLAREDDDMQRRDLCAVLGSAIAALLFPAAVQAEQETVTLEITGMS